MAINKHSILKRRSDLCWQWQASSWLVYDPLARVGYRCGEAERWLFDQFDGSRCLHDIHQQAAVHPAVQLISWAEILGLAEILWQRGLVRQSGYRTSTQEMTPARSWVQWFSQSVSWRLRGVNPERFLAWLAPHTDAFFSGIALKVWLVVMLIVGLLVMADFQRLLEQAQLWQWVIKPASGSTLFLIFLATRAIHELGHALVLTRFGGRSPDVGVIFMLGAPCVYCDVTESWRLAHVWQRAAVAAGGMWAESIVATLAAIVWLMTIDGATNTLALQTMIVCSISTWLVNANPLMRFDGYYILSDWCNEPNLRARADGCAMRWLKRLVLGQVDRAPLETSRPRYVGLIAFSVLGLVYRLSLSWMMASVIVAMYASWHFESIGRWIAIGLLGCWWGIPMMKLASQLIQAARSLWARTRLGLLAAWVVLMIGIVPIPCREVGQGWIQPEEMQGLYAPHSARLEKVNKFPGMRVQAGDVVLQLDDDSQRLHHLELEQQAGRAEVQLASWTKLKRVNQPGDIDLRAATSARDVAKAQAQHAAAVVTKMRVQATLDGKLISMPAPKAQDLAGNDASAVPELWLDLDQCGRIVPQGTMLAAVCSRQLLAVIPLKDMQLRDIGEGTSVRLLVPSHSQRVWTGQVKTIVRLDQFESMDNLMAAAAAQLARDSNQLPSDSGSSLQSQTKTGYAAIIALPFQDAPIHGEVRATFTVPPKTLATRASDWAHTNLRWLID